LHRQFKTHSPFRTPIRETNDPTEASNGFYRNVPDLLEDGRTHLILGFAFAFVPFL